MSRENETEEKPSHKKEREHKFGVSLGIDVHSFLSDLERIINEQGWNISPQKRIVRDVFYYDTPEYLAYKKGQTIRKVVQRGEEDPIKGIRYDFKQGSPEDRDEFTYRPGRELSLERLSNLVPADMVAKGEEESYKKLRISASAETEHYKYTIRKGEVVIDVKLDIYKVKGGKKFMELEIEMKNTPEANHLRLWDVLSEAIGAKMNLKKISVQKYDRVLSSILDARNDTLYGKKDEAK